VPITGCTFAPFWNGATFGFGSEILDGLDIGPAAVFAAVVPVALNTATHADAFDTDNDPLNGDTNIDDGSDASGSAGSVFLPMIGADMADDDPRNGDPNFGVEEDDAEDGVDETERVERIYLPLIRQ
ncbi:MAG: hypothetical protein DCC55_35170, partial [Chloroflexi bacterium]